MSNAKYWADKQHLLADPEEWSQNESAPIGRRPVRERPRVTTARKAASSSITIFDLSQFDSSDEDVPATPTRARDETSEEDDVRRSSAVATAPTPPKKRGRSRVASQQTQSLRRSPRNSPRKKRTRNSQK